MTLYRAFVDLEKALRQNFKASGYSDGFSHLSIGGQKLGIWVGTTHYGWALLLGPRGCKAPPRTAQGRAGGGCKGGARPIPRMGPGVEPPEIFLKFCIQKFTV